MNDKNDNIDFNKNKNKKNNSLREADLLTRDINSWWNKTFVFIKKTRIKTWKGVFIVAFAAGIAVATVMTVSFNIQTSSKAADGSVLSIVVDNENAALEDGYNLINADILLNTNENDIVAVKAVVNYNPADFQLQSYDTSNSVFNNASCSYNGGQCEIIDNDTANGKITITVAKPSPGVNTSSGIVAQLVFKALQTDISASPNLTLSFTAEGDYTDSDVIKDDGGGTDILSSVQNATVNIYSAMCSSYVYSDEWNNLECQQDGYKTRTVVSSLPEGCFAGNLDVQPDTSQECEYSGSTDCTSIIYPEEWSDCQVDGTRSKTAISTVPEDCISDDLTITESCTYVPPVCTNIEYDVEWGACQVNGKQTRGVVSMTPDNCEPEGDLELEQDCNYVAPTCDDEGFTYNDDWTDCQPDGTRTRTVASSSPAGCEGGNPETSGTCEYEGGSEDTTCTSFTYNDDWSDCQIGGTRTRTVASSSPEECTGGNPDTEEDCTFVAPDCSAFTYKDYGSCQPNGTQSRTVASSSPAGCAGGSPALTQSCSYSTASTIVSSSSKKSSSNKKKSSSSSSKKKKKKSGDKTKPVFTNMPLYLTKNKGDVIWWTATDNKGVKRYEINFNGKKVKTTATRFSVPTGTKSGVYILRIRAYDKAKNSKLAIVTVRIR